MSPASSVEAYKIDFCSIVGPHLTVTDLHDIQFLSHSQWKYMSSLDIALPCLYYYMPKP